MSLRAPENLEFGEYSVELAAEYAYVTGRISPFNLTETVGGRQIASGAITDCKYIDPEVPDWISFRGENAPSLSVGNQAGLLVAMYKLTALVMSAQALNPDALVGKFLKESMEMGNNEIIYRTSERIHHRFQYNSYGKGLSLRCLAGQPFINNIFQPGNVSLLDCRMDFTFPEARLSNSRQASALASLALFSGARTSFSEGNDRPEVLSSLHTKILSALEVAA